MEIPPITDDITHQQLLKVCLALVEMDPALNTVHGEYLDAIARAIEEYEKKTFLL